MHVNIRGEVKGSEVSLAMGVWYIALSVKHPRKGWREWRLSTRGGRKTTVGQKAMMDAWEATTRANRAADEILAKELPTWDKKPEGSNG